MMVGALVLVVVVAVAIVVQVVVVVGVVGNSKSSSKQLHESDERRWALFRSTSGRRALMCMCRC